MKPTNFFVGFDRRETVAYHTFAHSIMRHASVPVAITPIVQDMLRGRGLYGRDVNEQAATEFSLTRFLVPHMMGYRGIAIFADCDMVMKADVAELMDLALDARMHASDGPAVLVAKHDYVPRSASKMDGQIQTAYPRKNWSSFMVMDCQKCIDLSQHVVNTATPSDLHRFAWLKDEQIGDLPLEWNWLVGEYAENPHAKNLHYTLGGPWFSGLEHCEHAQDWYEARDAMLGVHALAGAA